MIAEKMKGMVANSSAIRAMFEEGNRLAEIYGAENAVSYTHLDVYKRQIMLWLSGNRMERSL